MKLDLRSCDQADQLRIKAEVNLCKGLYKASKKTQFVRLTGLGVGVAEGFMIIATQVALIAENLFKGVVNIIGAPFFKQCHIKRGLYQLLLETPKNAIVLPFTALVIFNIFITTLAVAVAPSRFFFNKWQEISKTDPSEQKIFFNNLCDEIAKDPNNSERLLRLGRLYEEGYGVEKSKEEALKAYLSAAQLGNQRAMLLVGNMYATCKDPDFNEARIWLEKAKSLGGHIGRIAASAIRKLDQKEQELNRKDVQKEKDILDMLSKSVVDS